ncbi:MAG: hypothetical protein WCJ19_04235 [bacterium]
MKVRFTQKYLQSIWIKILLGSVFTVAVYHIFFLFLDLLNLQNKYEANFVTIIITIIGFYFSVIPIKALSSIFPDWYMYTTNNHFPYSRNGWVFTIEQILVAIFVTVSIFAIYIIIMWMKRLYKRFVLKRVIVKKWSRLSIIVGISCFLYYVILLVIASILATQAG